jgi:hypothetical protein
LYLASARYFTLQCILILCFDMDYESFFTLLYLCSSKYFVTSHSYYRDGEISNQFLFCLHFSYSLVLSACKPTVQRTAIRGRGRKTRNQCYLHKASKWFTCINLDNPKTNALRALSRSCDQRSPVRTTYQMTQTFNSGGLRF